MAQWRADIQALYDAAASRGGGKNGGNGKSTQRKAGDQHTSAAFVVEKQDEKIGWERGTEL
jgi:hypothetical protein